MSQHDPDFDFEPIRGVPAPLPEGETILWQGAPGFRGLVIRALQCAEGRALLRTADALAFGAAVASGQARTVGFGQAMVLLPFAIAAIGILALIAWGYARTTVYTLTSRRLLIRSGIAIPVTLSLPLSKIASASVKLFGDGTGDIPVKVEQGERIIGCTSGQRPALGLEPAGAHASRRTASARRHEPPCLGARGAASVVRNAALAADAPASAAGLPLRPDPVPPSGDPDGPLHPLGTEARRTADADAGSARTLLRTGDHVARARDLRAAHGRGGSTNCPTPIVEYRELAFRDLSERGVEVIDPTNGIVLTRLARSEGGGFVQNVLSGMNVDRKRQGTPGEAPYRIARHADGRLYLNDPSTGRRQTVDAFGATQTAVFARLLAGGATTQGEKR